MILRAVLIALVLGFGAASPAFASDEEEDSRQFFSGLIEDDIFTAGETVDVDGEVNGDVFAAGGNVGINGRINDQLIAAGGQISVSSSVAGDAILAGGKLDLSGAIGDNLVAAGGSLTVRNQIAGKAMLAAGQVEVTRDARIAGDAWISGGQVILRGDLAGSARVNGGVVQIYGTVAGDMDIRAEEVAVMPGARIGGALTVRGPRAPDVAATATVGGDVQHIKQEGLEGLKEKASGLIVMAMLLPFLFGFVLGLVLIFGAPAWVAATATAIRSRPLASVGLGFLVVFGVPGILGALAFTVIGLPITIIGFAVFTILMTLALPLFVLAVARLLLMRKADAAEPARGWQLLLFAGLLVAFGFLGIIPVVGQFILGAALLLGAGAGLIALYDMTRGKEA